MIEASRDVACIFIECDWGKKNEDLSTRFRVQGYPAVIFCDAQGNMLGEMNHRDPDKVAKALQALAKFGAVVADPPPDNLVIFGPDYEKARAAARRAGKFVLLYFGDISPASISINDALLDPSLRDLHPRFSTAKAEFAKGSAFCLKFNVSRAPTILILDPRLERPEEKPVLRIEGSRSVRELRRELESVLPARDPGTTPPPGGADLPPVRRDAPEEKLSDDEIERKFIWARVAVAQDTFKRGSKEKAFEILEDVLKSYPKHKDTADVKKVLEDLRKK